MHPTVPPQAVRHRPTRLFCIEFWVKISKELIVQTIESFYTGDKRTYPLYYSNSRRFE